MVVLTFACLLSPISSSVQAGRRTRSVGDTGTIFLCSCPFAGAVCKQLLALTRLAFCRPSCILKIGKWHVGARSPAQLPTARGFNTSLGFLNGAENHFTQMASGAHMHAFTAAAACVLPCRCATVPSMLCVSCFLRFLSSPPHTKHAIQPIRCRTEPTVTRWTCG